MAHSLFRRVRAKRSRVPYISFTFDDFPASAWRIGGTILGRVGLRATYYASLGLLGTEAPTGPIFTVEDLRMLLDQGHEVGCHTFAHCHSWNTPTREYEDSIMANLRAFNQLVPGASFRSFAYPISGPRPLTKWRVGRYFNSCRGGGQTFNAGHFDLNYLRAFFLEKTRGDIQPIRDMIDRNCAAQGWLIFATHDVCDRHTPFGCKPAFFERVVEYALESGAQILPVTEALNAVQVAM